MSEKLHHSGHEIDLPKAEHGLQKNIEQHLEKEAHKAKHEHKDSIDKILHTIEKEAITSETINKHHLDGNKHTSGPVGFGAELRKRSIDDNLKKIQRELPGPQKTFSKLIHQPVINAVSEVSSKTVARPSGLLFAGLLSMVTSLGLLIACRYYGYRYNFLIGLVALGVGFGLGLILELIFSLFRRTKTS